MFVGDLQPYSDEQIFRGLKRCREEIQPVKGFVTFNLAILIDKMGVPKGEDLQQAEAEVQWDLLNRNIRWYDDGPGCYWVGGQPELSAKGSAALRRIGGWQKLENWAKHEEWHFTRRDFIDSCVRHEDIEYAAALPEASGKRGELTSVSDIVKQFRFPL